MNDDAHKAKIVSKLMSCLASSLHHSDPIKRVIQLHPVNPLSQVPVLSDDTILSNTKPLVTTGSPERMGSPTGIPHHVIVMVKLIEVLTLLK